jgi:hypothetical protein
VTSGSLDLKLRNVDISGWPQYCHLAASSSSLTKSKPAEFEPHRRLFAMYKLRTFVMYFTKRNKGMHKRYSQRSKNFKVIRAPSYLLRNCCLPRDRRAQLVCSGRGQHVNNSCTYFMYMITLHPFELIYAWSRSVRRFLVIVTWDCIIQGLGAQMSWE